MRGMLPDRILLVDRSKALVEAWAEAFEDVEGVSAQDGDFFAHPADAMVSPANSFGIMDGGLDLAIRDRLGHAVQRSAQDVIVARFHGELPVGMAVVVRTGAASWPHVVVAPTMRVPENVAHTLNPYLAFRAALLAVAAWNREADAPAIRSILCPGLGTGIGGVEPKRCALQMRMALLGLQHPARIPSFAQIHAVHEALRGA
jgi:O-acetyl-ADP-ribose deacetylase (regulator of RNase III)